MDPDIHAHFIHQGDGAYRIPEFHHGIINGMDINPFFHQEHGFIEHENQDTGGIKGGPVLYNNAGFSLFNAKINGSGRDPVRCFVRCYDLKKGHASDRGKVVHADHVFRTLAVSCNLSDGEGRSIGCKYGFFIAGLFNIIENFFL